ncbi:hypothetical protein [Streptomyces pseudogriseolus]|uniref:hypothetical protein n=1 Tax=Streptomyces pseudogriseolus TaxID=36817 RepID=UPI001CE2359A|nr:hypothetical protein [Streptomyces pseudogriseolus]
MTLRKRRNRLAARILGAAAAGALAMLAVTTGLPESSTQESPELVVDEAPGYAVEDFNYPFADEILAEKGIVLKRGDGHITLADCVVGTGQIEISTRSSEDNICFDTVGDEGWLTLEIPAVYSIKGNDYATTVDLTVGTEEKTVEVRKNAWTPVGESADPQGRDHMLVEIRTVK